MSRIGKLPIELPSGVSATLSGKVVTVTGSKGTLNYELPSCLSLAIESQSIEVVLADEAADNARAFWGLARALIANMVVGVSQGYKKSLEIQGVGYKFELNGNKITCAVGFSHKVTHEAPAGITLANDPNEKNVIHISGIDKQQVGYFTALIRSTKKPEPYKGKGIRYVGEQVRRKAGKTAGKK
jgi:large subunit ribosomal protein L6